MTLTESQIAEVKETLDNYCTAYRNKDIRALMALFAPDLRGFGSGPDEIIPNRKEYSLLTRRDMTQATSMSVEFPGLKIFGDGRVAWMTAFCNCTFVLADGKKQFMKGRMTMVLQNTGSRWLISQLHFSMPNVAQDPGQSFSGE